MTWKLGLHRFHCMKVYNSGFGFRPVFNRVFRAAYDASVLGNFLKKEDPNITPKYEYAYYGDPSHRYP